MAAPISESTLRSTPLAELERLTPAQLERLGRIAFPVIAAEGDTHFRRLSWSDAFERAAAGLRTAPPEEVFFYSSGRSSNEAAFLMQLVARAYGTPNIHNCSFYCHNASSVALNEVTWFGTASWCSTTSPAPTSSWRAPTRGRIIRSSPSSSPRRGGGKVIVLNGPRARPGPLVFRPTGGACCSPTVSDLYLQPHVGSDVALLKAPFKGVVEAGGIDQTSSRRGRRLGGGRSRSRDVVDTPSPRAAWRVPTSSAVRAVARRPPGNFRWAMGLTHHVHGRRQRAAS
jgi:anaerobic selenocysteine-containing dehydrogenase